MAKHQSFLQTVQTWRLHSIGFAMPLLKSLWYSQDTRESEHLRMRAITKINITLVDNKVITIAMLNNCSKRVYVCVCVCVCLSVLGTVISYICRCHLTSHVIVYLYNKQYGP